jgi:macrolide transport system ATP-binding/permease protein
MNIIRRLQYLFHDRRRELDLAEEMEFHRAMVEKDLQRSGLTSGDASIAGRRAMGAATQMREAARAVWIWPWLESAAQDAAYAARSMRRQPGFALVAIAVLACAIGLNTSLFTVFNAVALRPWSVPEPGRVARIFGFIRNPPKGLDHYRGFSVPEYRFLAEHTRTMAGLLFQRGESGLLLEQRKARYVFVSGNYFQALGVGMERGRGFLPEEDRTDAPQAVGVISYFAWQGRFGGDPNIIGRQVRMQDSPFVVVGVAPSDFAGTEPERTDLWLPLASMATLYPGDSWAQRFLHDRHNCCGDLAGRLAPGHSRAEARAELSLLTAEYARQFQESSDGVVLAGTPFLAGPAIKGQVRAVFGLMFAGVTLVLLLACANVGNLLLARGVARRREIAVRLSLGAGRARVVRQLLTESLVLAIAAGILGVALAWILPQPLLRQAAGEVSFRLQPDATVLAYTLALAMLACVACGLAPALATTRGGFHHAGPQGLGRLSLRSSLLAIQVSVSVILLVGAGLLIRGIEHARATDPGFAVEGTASLAIDLPASAYPTPAIRAFFQTLSQSLENLPAAQPFGWSDLEPLGSARGFTGFRLPGQDEKQTRLVLLSSVSAGYFEILRIPILAGRNFQPADAAGATVLVNQAMADKYFPAGDGLGKTIVTDRPKQIVGIVRNAHTAGLDAVDPMVYVPANFGAAPRLLVRGGPDALAAVTSLVKSMEPRARVSSTALSRNLDRWLSNSRVGAAIAGLLGMLALLLAAIGIAGVFAYAVEQRKREIGIRMALGARPVQLLGAVFGPAARSMAAGLALGMAGAFAGSGLLRQYLFGISRLDAPTYAAVLGTLAMAGLASTYLPARRAAAIDPAESLRHD